MIKKNGILTSDWVFSEDELELKGKFQMMNIAFMLSSFGLVFGISANLIKESYFYIPYEVLALLFNLILFISLRKSKKIFPLVAFMESLQFTLLFLFFIYTSEIESLRFIWIFAYPIVLLYFQSEKSAIYWIVMMLVLINIAPYQPFIAIDYTPFQVVYMSVVLLVISGTVYFYQKKMDEAKSTIFEQQALLKKQLNELTQKDKLLTVQSKQAVMGEMISMIAHQWRQPLSTVTLSISDLQVKKMLGTPVDDAELDAKLQDISDTVVYLSETIDDFQTYFKPNKEINRESIHETVEKAVNFVKSRIYKHHIVLNFIKGDDFIIETYQNELIQVILNILNNAIDELAKLEREELKIDIEISDLEDSLILKIEDNADGISLENIESIFEPYYSTKGKNGTGLGLYMSQMIMQKQFNSKIEVSSSSKGSSFSMRVPKKLS